MKFSDLFRTAAVAALSLAVAAVPAMAKGPKAKTTVAKPTSAGPKAKAPKAQAPKAAKAQAPKATATGTATTRSTSTKGSSTRTTSTRTTTTRTGDGTPATSLQDFAAPQPLSKAQQKLLANENLRNKILGRLPLGTDPMIAASGFSNLGQFVAAVNVSNNLGIDFNMLKGMMVNRGMSLGQAIQQAKAFEARRATSLANTAIVRAEDEITATSLQSVTAAKRGKGKS